jgi:hypothetical protein
MLLSRSRENRVNIDASWNRLRCAPVVACWQSKIITKLGTRSCATTATVYVFAIRRVQLTNKEKEAGETNPLYTTEIKNEGLYA